MTAQVRHWPRLKFVLALTILAVGWLIVLPWMAARPSTAARIRWLQRHGIDPNAMFYTELDAMQPILQRLERRGTP